MINSADLDSTMLAWPPVLGLFKSVAVTLTYLRRNRAQAEIGEAFGVSQPTISRAVSAITALTAKVLGPYVPTADDLDEDTQYIVDGTLLPCWSWATHPELYSGKHKTTGMNIQVACTITGHLSWISDPVPGSRHDSYCLGESGVLPAVDPGDWIGDKGYQSVATPGRVLHTQDIDHRHGNDLRPDDLPDPSLVRLGQYEAGRRLGSGLLVLFDPEDQQSTCGVGKRGYIGRGISLLPV